jgi:serine/threonine protein kinase
MEGKRVETHTKDLEFEYRDYMENSEGLPAGTEIGEYKIDREIGKGAFGKIYLARDRRGGSFAVKLMDLEKIRREANPKIQ